MCYGASGFESTLQLEYLMRVIEFGLQFEDLTGGIEPSLQCMRHMLLSPVCSLRS